MKAIQKTAGFGGASAPAGWLPADGTLYTTTGYYKDDNILVAYPTPSPGSLSWAQLRQYLLQRVTAHTGPQRVGFGLFATLQLLR